MKKIIPLSIVILMAVVISQKGVSVQTDSVVKDPTTKAPPFNDDGPGGGTGTGGGKGKKK
jgi:hypothetical protein